jgi:hypothetical protein
MIGRHRCSADAGSPAGRSVATARRLAALVASLGAVLALAACGSSTAGTGSHLGTATSSTSSTSSTPTGPAGSSTVSTSAAGSTAPPTASPTAGTGCSNVQIAVTATNPPGGAAAGHDGVVLLFTNRSSSACTLAGYPGVAGLNSSGQQIAQATRTLDGYLAGCACRTPAVLTLNPGAVGSATVEAVDALNGGPCTPFAGLLVTAPNTTRSTRISLAPYSCQFDVHPVVAGSAGTAR